MADKTKEPEAAPEPVPALPDDGSIPVNVAAVAAAPKRATEACPFCGATKLKAAVPGQETPEEYCPGCGRGAAVEVA